jgi:hypothetical protein
MTQDGIRSIARKYGGKTTTAATVLILVLQNAGLIGTVRGGGTAEDNGDLTRLMERHVRQEQEVVEVLKEIRSTNRIGLLTICVQLAKVPDNCLRIQ